MFRHYRFALVGLAICSCSTPAWSTDARSIALGGSVIANGKGVHGALENPASLMNMQREEQRIHFRFGMATEVRDTGSSIETLLDEDNEDVINDIETQIDSLSDMEVQCDPIFGNDDDVCVGNTQELSDLANQLLDIIDVVDNETIDIQATADFGIAYTTPAYPFSVNLRVMGTGYGKPDVSEVDKAYIGEFADLLDGNTLTLEETKNSTYLEANELGIPLGVQQPEDILQSEGSGNTLIRAQLAVSFAKTLDIGQHSIDLGITPKISSLRAYNLDVKVAEEFQDGTPALDDRFEDSEVTESSFTFDLGSSMMLPYLPIRVAAVVRNLIPESITTTDGFEFETTPQLIVGGLFQTGLLNLTGDIALNKAKVDNFETQKIAFGAEFGTRMLAIRGGISHDSARKNDATSLSLGFGLGPLEIGGRLVGAESLEAGVQLSYSFM